MSPWSTSICDKFFLSLISFKLLKSTGQLFCRVFLSLGLCTVLS